MQISNLGLLLNLQIKFPGVELLAPECLVYLYTSGWVLSESCNH